MAEKTSFKTISENRQVRHEYFVEETYEAGIELYGTEVKSLRAGTVNMKDSWCSIDDGELFIKQLHISPYEHGNIFNRDPLRVRRLLMHKSEIHRLLGLLKRDGYTLIPLSLYFKGSRVKVKVGLCKGKKLYDKRADAAKRDAQRTIDRAMKQRTRSLFSWGRKGFDGDAEVRAASRRRDSFITPNLKLNANNNRVALAA